MRNTLDGVMQQLQSAGARLASAALAAALLVASASACSSPAPERAYATPKELCGTKVSAAFLEPLLPPGKKISAQPRSSVGTKRCYLLVDGAAAFSSSVELRGAGVSARDVAASAIGIEPTDTGAGGGRFIYSRTGAVGRVECSGSARRDSSLWVTVRTAHPSAAADMLKLVNEYANSVAQGGGCGRS